jgi:predicted nucleic acid-binding protein
MLIDSFAWIEYFMGTEMGEEVKQVVGRAEERRSFIVKRCAVIPIDEVIAVEAAKIHAEAKKTMEDFGLADAFVLSSARYKNVKVLTGDPHFKEFSESIML